MIDLLLKIFCRLSINRLDDYCIMITMLWVVIVHKQIMISLQRRRNYIQQYKLLDKKGNYDE